MVGNDIIDIHEARRASNWERPGFMQKIFTLKEQTIITNSTDPFKTVWRLWSMKESAYKVFVQAGGERFFNPTKIECRIDSLEDGQAEIATTTLKTVTSMNAHYIFSTATMDNAALDTCIFKLKANNSKQQSHFIHQQLLDDFAKTNALDLAELQLVKTAAGVPTLHYHKEPMNTSISITHHGNYGAYSILKHGVASICSF